MTDLDHSKKMPTFLKSLIPIAVILVLAIGALVGVKHALKRPVKTAPLNQTIAKGEVGSIVDDFEFKLLGGKTQKLSNLSKKVILINFWATWCEACMEEMPSMVKLYQSYKDKGFEILGINVDENPESVVPGVIKKLGIDFLIGLDPDGNLGEAFDVHAIPLSLMIDQDKKILMVESGGRDWNDTETRTSLEGWLGKK